MTQHSTQPSENSKAIVHSIKFFAGFIIIAAVIYSEVLFLGIVSGLFPQGALAIGAMIGAVTTGMSVLALCLGKSHWFRPGMQLVIAWIFTGIEVAVLIANDILAYQLHTNAHLDQFTSTWRLFCVATPALSLVGWILLFFFSPERSIMHKRMELEDRQQKGKVDLDTAVHQKAMHFHYRAIDMVGSGMEAQMERLMPAYTELAARQKLAAIASDLTGTHISHTQLGGRTPRRLNARIVDADPVEEEEMEEEEVAHNPQVIDPYQQKDKVDTELARKKALEQELYRIRKKEEAIERRQAPKQTQKIDTSEEEVNDDDPLEPDYAEDDIETSNDRDNWSLVDWRQRRNDVDAWTFDNEWKEYHGDTPFPDDRESVKKKSSTGGRKPSNSSRTKSTGRPSTSSKKASK